MPAVQTQSSPSPSPVTSPRATPSSARASRRRRWLPTNWSENYRLPLRIANRLQAETATFRNREAVYRLFVLLARHHAAPRTIRARGLGAGFAIDRRALSGSKEGMSDAQIAKVKNKIDLTEDQVRGAIKQLVRIGAIEPLHNVEDLYQPGMKRNRPQMYRFAGDYAQLLSHYSRRKATVRVSERVQEKEFSISESPKDKRRSEAKPHSGELDSSSRKRLPRGRDILRSDHAPSPVKPPQMPVRLSDEAIWTIIDRDLAAGLRDTALYWETMSHLTDVMRREAIKAERQNRGGGLAMLRLMLLQPRR